MSVETISYIALALCLAPGLFHSVELLYPTWGSRFIINWVLPFFGKHPRMAKRGITVGYIFTPFWITSTLLNYLAIGS